MSDSGNKDKGEKQRYVELWNGKESKICVRVQEKV